MSLFSEVCRDTLLLCACPPENDLSSLPEGMMDDLSRALPDEIKTSTLWPGNQLALPYAEALKAIGVATEHQIAVLGFEVFEVQKDGLLIVDYSGHDTGIAYTGDWLAFVAAMNSEAECWIKKHRFGANHGYVLCARSENEFASNMLKLGSPEQLADLAIVELLRRFRASQES
jgi:hypothetical protein